MVAPAKRPITGSGSLLISYRLSRSTPILIIGAGKEAAGRLYYALDASAPVIIIAPDDNHVDPTLRKRILEWPQMVEWRKRDWSIQDLNDNIDIVFSCLESLEESQKIYLACKERHLLCNCADLPSCCDFYFPSTLRRGPVQIAVSTNGNGPRMAARIRKVIDDVLPQSVGLAVEKIGDLRRKLQFATGGIGGIDAGKRMSWVSQLCDSWSWEELAALSDTDIEYLIKEFEKGSPTPLTPSSRINGKY